jgi:ribonuclease HII
VAIIAGIDEAGLGPVLGPLVVSAAAFSLPDESAHASLWQLLAAAVARRPGKRHTRIAIADSKDLYGGLRGAAGLGRLERGVLAMLATRGLLPQSLAGLLEIVSPPAVREASAHPWYRQLQLPLPAEQSLLEAVLSANALDAAMQQAKVKLLALRSETVFEREFNRLTQATNKAQMLLDVTSRLLLRLWQMAEGQRLIIHVDHQGGRVRYLEALARVFEGCSFKVLEEDESRSSYRLTAPARQAEIHFAVNCENRQLPVALASMTSKYLRELFMRIYNSYWSQHVPDLAPTAGYYTDGRRFYQAIQPAVRKMGIDEQMLYRLR